MSIVPPTPVAEVPVLIDRSPEESDDALPVEKRTVPEVSCPSPVCSATLPDLNPLTSALFNFASPLCAANDFPDNSEMLPVLELSPLAAEAT